MEPQAAPGRGSDPEQEVRRLRRAVDELSILNEIATAIGSTLSLKSIVELIIEKCVKHLKVEQGAVLLHQPERPDKPFRTVVRQADSAAEVVPLRFGDQLTGWMLHHQKPLLINDLATDPRFQAPPAGFPIRSLLSVPLPLKGQMIGVLTVFNKRAPGPEAAEGFTEGDQRLLAIIAAQSAQVIENARLYEEEQALRRIQEELRLAWEIQTSLLPKERPSIPGYELAGKSVPARNVGGDYFDFIPCEPNRLAVCLGDVSGKGMPAALLMANLQATIRGQALVCGSAAGCLRRANALLFRSTDAHKFATLFYGILDTVDHQLSYSNAGHNPPLLFRGRDAEPERLGTGGLILGALEDFPYDEVRVALRPGDLLLLYSDGITEAESSREEEFGEERLAAVVRRNWEVPSLGLVETILGEVQRHAGDCAPMDDMTLVVLRRQRR